ncbi:MAG: hypothetical protein ACE5EM_00675 [Sphingomonadales bacterium]
MKMKHLLGFRYVFALIPVLAVSASPVGWAGVTVRIDDAACRFLTRHVPAPDIRFEPGVDVRGNPVTPADLGSGPALKPRQVFTIDIELDLEERFGIPAGSPLFRNQANIGVIEVRGEHVYFDGQRLDAPEQRALAAACEDKAVSSD